LLATSSIIALSIAATPVTVDLGTPHPILKTAMGGEGGESGGEGSGDGGGEGEGSGDGSGGSEGGESGESESSGSSSSSESGASGGSPFGGLEQVGPDLSPSEEAKEIAKGWQ